MSIIQKIREFFQVDKKRRSEGANSSEFYVDTYHHSASEHVSTDIDSSVKLFESYDISLNDHVSFDTDSSSTSSDSTVTHDW